MLLWLGDNQVEHDIYVTHPQTEKQNCSSVSVNYK